MRRLLFGLFAASFLLLVSCGDNTAAVDAKNSGPDGSKPSPLAREASGGAVVLETLDIAGVAFSDLISGQTAGFSDKNFIMEFRSFILNQAYSVTNEDWENSHCASLLDSGGTPLLRLTLGARSVIFDRDVEIKGILYEKSKTYETEKWVYDYMRQFLEGKVLDPVHIAYPARLRLPEEYYDAEMSDKGSLTVNKYETLAGLYAFVEDHIIGRDFEITGAERPYTLKEGEEEDAREDGARVIRVGFDSSGYMHINSANEYDELAGVYPLCLYRDTEGSGEYRLAAAGEVFRIKVDDAFDRAFQELFDKDAETRFKLAAHDIEELFRQKKPWFMEYICRNLGMELWHHREDDTLKKGGIKLGSGINYTALSIKNPFDLRLMLFNNKSGAFIDYIDFGGRFAGTEFTIERAGEYSWIAGNRNRGHGTGEDINNREWYTVDDSGKKLALSIPYDTYEVGPYGGSIFKAEDIRLVNGEPVRLKVDYSLTRVYMLDIAGADEGGQVKVSAEKKVEFEWDAGRRIFTSAFPTDERGLTRIPPECEEITGKCGDILEKEYDRLVECINALDAIDNKMQKDWKSGALEQFLRDCPDSAKKAALMKLLSEKSAQD